VRKLGIPAVIGMTERVTIKTAHALAEAFYRQFLAQGKIGEVDRALVEAYAGLSGRTDVNVMSGGITDWALVGVTVRKSPQTNAANDGVSCSKQPSAARREAPRPWPN